MVRDTVKNTQEVYNGGSSTHTDKEHYLNLTVFSIFKSLCDTTRTDTMDFMVPEFVLAQYNMHNT